MQTSFECGKTFMSYFRTFIFEKVSFLKSSVFNTSYTAKYCLNVHFFLM